MHKDARGTIKYNNDFDLTAIKRIYLIENSGTELTRGWQGHRIEQRWFTAVEGMFEIALILIDDWESPSKDLEKRTYFLNSNSMNVLHIPQGYITSIKAKKPSAKLLVFSDYHLGEIHDEFKYDLNYFNK